MLSGEFEIYGQAFRWCEEAGAEEDADRQFVPLIRMRRPFAPERVTWLTRCDGHIPAYGKLEGSSVCLFEGVAAFVFPPDGRYLQMFIDPAADHGALEFVLFRGVLPRILHLRGVTCLHASAVAVDGGVVVFCGPSGAGKSTLAAALVSRGFPLVSDDVVPIRIAGSGTEVTAGPGLPELRVYPAAAERLGIADQVIPPTEDQIKARWQPRRAPDKALPLLAIYLLEAARRGSSEQPAAVQALSAPEALLALIPNCYWVELGQTSALGNDMLCLGKVLRSVRVERLIFDFSERGFAAVEELITAPAAIGVQ